MSPVFVILPSGTVCQIQTSSVTANGDQVKEPNPSILAQMPLTLISGFQAFVWLHGPCAQTRKLELKSCVDVFTEQQKELLVLQHDSLEVFLLGSDC